MSFQFPLAILNFVFLSFGQEKLHKPSGHHYIGIVHEEAIKTI